MKYQIKFTHAYKKSRYLMKKRGLDMSILDEVISKIANEEQLEEKHKDHELSGKFKGFRECHVKPDWLPIYLIEKEVLILTLVNADTLHI